MLVILSKEKKSRFHRTNLKAVVGEKENWPFLDMPLNSAYPTGELLPFPFRVSWHRFLCQSPPACEAGRFQAPPHSRGKPWGAVLQALERSGAAPALGSLDVSVSTPRCFSHEAPMSFGDGTEDLAVAGQDPTILPIFPSVKLLLANPLLRHVLSNCIPLLCFPSLSTLWNYFFLFTHLSMSGSLGN